MEYNVGEEAGRGRSPKRLEEEEKMCAYKMCDPFGNVFWKNEKGELHREDGPAIEKADGCKEWFVNGVRHRWGGPAIESPNGYNEWWVDGKGSRERIFFPEELEKIHNVRPYPEITPEIILKYYDRAYKLISFGGDYHTPGNMLWHIKKLYDEEGGGET